MSRTKADNIIRHSKQKPSVEREPAVLCLTLHHLSVYLTEKSSQKQRNLNGKCAKLF